MPELNVGDVVELTNAVDAAPIGSKGGVTDILDEDRVIVEVTTLPPEPVLDRIVVVSPAVLRVIGGQSRA
jgi:hypothetical protein